MSKHSPEPRKTNIDAIADLTRQRDELLDLVKRARLEWLSQNQTSDDTDVVTPYDHVLYRGDC